MAEFWILYVIPIYYILLQILCSRANNGSYQICSVHNDSKSSTMHLTTTCRTCSSCTAGQFMKEHCSSTSDTVCAACPPGTFSKADNSRTCKACSTCSDTNQVTLSNCSKTDDAVCSCSEGTFLQQGVCRDCTSCAAGYYVTKRCSKITNTVCSPCRPGSFTPKINTAEYCQACSICRRNHVDINRCTSTKNKECGGCKEGYYENENTGDCEQCSYCYPERPGYTFQVEACLQIKTDINWTCMPVTQPPPPLFEYASPDSDRTSTEISMSTLMEISTVYSTTTEIVELKAYKYTATISVSIVFIICVVVMVVVLIRFRHKKRCEHEKRCNGVTFCPVLHNYYTRLKHKLPSDNHKERCEQMLLHI